MIFLFYSDEKKLFCMETSGVFQLEISLVATSLFSNSSTITRRWQSSIFSQAHIKTRLKGKLRIVSIPRFKFWMVILSSLKVRFPRFKICRYFSPSNAFRYTFRQHITWLSAVNLISINIASSSASIGFKSLMLLPVQPVVKIFLFIISGFSEIAVVVIENRIAVFGNQFVTAARFITKCQKNAALMRKYYSVFFAGTHL